MDGGDRRNVNPLVITRVPRLEKRWSMKTQLPGLAGFTWPGPYRLCEPIQVECALDTGRFLIDGLCARLCSEASEALR